MPWDGWSCVTVCFHNTRAHFCSDPFSCAPCVSEGVSLEEQVRRIKDIEAIESDSFVPQAFKSSRDDTKVRSVSLSLSCYLFSLSLIGFTSPRCYAVCPETAQTKSNIHSAPFVPTWDGFIRRSAVQRLQSGSTHTKATPRQQPSSVSFSPFWLCRCRQNTKVIIGASPKEQEFNLLGLRAVLKRKSTTCDSSPTRMIWVTSWWVWQRSGPTWLQLGLDWDAEGGNRLHLQSLFHPFTYLTRKLAVFHHPPGKRLSLIS